MWKLAQKFTSLNPDLDNLQKIKWVIAKPYVACNNHMHRYIYRCMLCLYRMWEHFLYNCCEGVWRASDLTLMDLCCLLQGIHHYCSGAAVRAGHHVDLRLFPVWGRHDCHVLPVHHTWQPSGRYALCHALSVFQTGWSNSCQKKKLNTKTFFSFGGKTRFVFWFQVREEYGLIGSRFCAPRKAKYSEFISSQSKAQVSRFLVFTCLWY